MKDDSEVDRNKYDYSLTNTYENNVRKINLFLNSPFREIPFS